MTHNDLLEDDDPISPLLSATTSPTFRHHFNSALPLSASKLPVVSSSPNYESSSILRRRSSGGKLDRRRRSSETSELGILSTLSSLLNYGVTKNDQRKSFFASVVGWGGTPCVVSRQDDETNSNLKDVEVNDYATIGSEVRSTRARIATQSPVELPPSPFTIPGGWNDDISTQLEGSLFLPPPFLDELSSKDSFDGLFGSRAARQSKIAALRIASSIARDRPPLPPFPQSLLVTASKVVAALGPPEWNKDDVSDYDGAGRTTRETRKMTARAEEGMKGLELGERWLGRRFERKARGVIEEESGEMTQENVDTDYSPATPLSMFSPDQSRRPTITIVPSVVIPRPLPKPRLGPIASSEEFQFSPLPTPLQLDSVSDEDYFMLDGSATTTTAPDPTSPSDTSPASFSMLSQPASPSISILNSPRCSITDQQQHKHRHQHKHQSSSSFDFVLHLLVHLFGFLYFLSIHSSSLLISTLSASQSICIFLRWAFMNVTGQTELSIVLYESFNLCQKEWTKVGAEDGFIVLGMTNVVVGLLELTAIHTMTRRRYLIDGPGELSLLNGIIGNGGDVHPRRRGSRFDEGEGDSLLVTGGEDSILSATIVNNGFNFSTERDHPLKMPSSPPLRPLPNHALPTLVKTINRMIKYGAASYGLHSYILLPPSPLTTSDSSSSTATKVTLPQRIFSHLGQIDQSNVLHFAIQRNYLTNDTLNPTPQFPQVTAESYAPAFYVLRDDMNSEIVCVIRGTQSLSDIKTDLETTMVEMTLPSFPSASSDSSNAGGMEKYMMHAGILATAKNLLEKNSVLLKKLIGALQENKGYSLVLTGHSLGAGIASAFALLVGQYNPSASDTVSIKNGHWTTSASSGLPVDRPIRSYCFAHPATIDAKLSARCRAGIEPLVVSISLGSDVVCRVGVPQVCEVRRILGRLAIKRRKFLQQRKPSEHGQLEILRSFWTWKRLQSRLTASTPTPSSTSTSSDDQAIQNLQNQAWEWRKEIEQFHELKDEGMYIPAGRCLHLDFLPAALEAQRRADLNRREGTNNDEEDEEEGVMMGLYEVAHPKKFYSSPHLESDAISSHLPKYYLDAIESL